MKKQASRFRTTVVGGILFLIPFFVILYALWEVFKIALRVVIPLAELMPFQSLVGLETPWVLALLLLISTCYLAGVIARTKMARRLIVRIETGVLSHLPGYSFMKVVGEEFAGDEPNERYVAILVHFDDCKKLGCLVERLAEGYAVVYLPGSPKPWSGEIVVVEEQRVTLLTHSSRKLVQCLSRLGEGADSLLNGKLKP